MDSYLEPAEAPKKAPADASKRTSEVIKKPEPAVIPLKEPAAGRDSTPQPLRKEVTKPAEVPPPLPKKDPAAVEQKAQPKFGAPPAAAAVAATGAAGHRESGRAARDSGGIAKAEPKRTSLAPPASGTNASGRHSVPASVTAAVAAGGRDSGSVASAGASSSSPRSPGRAASPGVESATTIPATTSSVNAVPPLSKADSVILAAAPAPRKKPARKAKSEKKRESFYASDRFRAREATERDETDELAGVKTARDVEEQFRAVPSEVFRALAELRDIAREANTEVLTPEFVVIGLAGHGKSSVVEAILGWPLLHVEFGNPSKRPVRLSVQNNPACPEPRFTLMSDASLGVKRRVAFSDYRELRKELSLRLGQSKDLVKTPVHVLVEHAEALNYDITECPGLNPFAMDDAAAQLVMEMGRPVHRQLIVVEECIEWDKVNHVLLQTVLNLDPNLVRTIFVHSKLNTMLQGLYNAVDVSRYFSGIVRAHSDTQSFWATGLSQIAREKSASGAQYRLRLAQARERDITELAYLQADRRFFDFVGLTSLRAHVLRLVVSRIRACVPQIYFSLKTRQDNAAGLCKALATSLSGGLDVSHAKAFGLSFVNQFVSFLENSVAGTLEVNPLVHGETALDEGRVDWYEEDYELSSCKLVGGQQFQRLQMEIRHVVSGLDFDAVLPASDYPDPAGAIKSDEALRMAATMAHTCLTKGIAPIFYQACNRAEHILLHAFSVFDSSYAVSVTELTDAGNQQRFVLAHSPYFRNLIRDKYAQFLAERRKQLEKELREELLSPQTLLWSVMTFPAVYAPPKTNTQGRVANTVQIHGAAPETPKSGRIPAADPSDRYKGLSNEARAELEKVQAEQKARLMKPRAVGKRLFTVQRNRIVGDITLKFYKHLMAPLLDDLAEYLGAFVLGLERLEDVRELFNFTSVTEELHKKKSEMDRVVDFLRESTETYHRASTLFLTLVKPLEH
jgi:hypothetical protein